MTERLDSQDRQRRRPSRLMRATAREMLLAGGILAGSTAVGAGISHGIAIEINQLFREKTGFSEAENQAVRKRLKELQEDKARRGITREPTPTNVMERLRHFMERLWGEFKGDISEWVKESEPILALRVKNVQMLEYLDWFTYYPIFAFFFILITPRIYRTVDRYVRRMRISLTEEKVREHEGRIADLERASAELKRLEGLVKTLYDKDTKTGEKLTDEELKQLQALILRGIEIINTLSPEAIPPAGPEKKE